MSRVLFKEPYVAVKSMKSWYTRSASTMGCLHVTVTQRELITSLHLFAFWIKPLKLDLEHIIPLQKITAAENLGSVLFYDAVKVEFRDKSNHPQHIHIYMRKSDGFLSIINQSRSN